jgi:pimeloyl-ACP methyl ester carboxylesterase
MYVERNGAGPRRFLGLHGWSGDHRTFDPLIPHLPPDATLFAPDLPGCGRTPPLREWRLEVISAALTSLIRELANPTLTLIGNSSGAILALCAAVELIQTGAAATIGRLVLIDPLAYWPWYFRVFVSQRIGHYAYACSFGHPVGRWLVNAALAGKRTGQTHLTEGFTSVSGAVALSYLRMLRSVSGPEHYALIQAPIDILCGERTFASVRKSAARYQQIWPQARVYQVPGAGHLPLKEAPAAVAGRLFGRELCPTI